MSSNRLTFAKVATAAVTPLMFASGAQASGFAVPEISIAGLGLSNAMVANTSDVGSIAYNPAAMAFLGEASAGGGLMFINPNNSVSDPFNNEGKTFDGETPDWIGTVMGHGHVALNDSLLVGVSVNTPFGLETKWPSEAFSQGFSKVGADGAEPTHSKLELISASPSLTWKVNDNAALAAGFDIYWVRDLKFNTASTVICCGEGTGTGFHVAGLYHQGPWSFGASYYSTSKIDVEDGKVQNSLLTIDAETQLEMPWRAQIGVGYQVTETVNLEFDITRTGWSSFDKLEIWASKPPYSLSGEPLVASTNDWKDANGYRFGVTWDLSEATRLRFGYSYDETPQDDDHFSARIPGSDRQLFSVGIRQALSNGWELEGGYMYVKLNDRKIDSKQNPTTPDPNGTWLFNGDYEGHSHLVGLGVNKRF